MTAITYDFQQQLAEGQAYERQLDQHFSRFDIDIRPAMMDEQRQGIDRFFTHRPTGIVDTMEYKADSLAGKTGNAFVETISVDTTNKPGWAVASKAKYLVYLVTEPETIYLVSMKQLRQELPRWQATYRTTSAANDGYRTHGVLVPLHELERIAIAVW
jgi:hypothetical protein